MGCGQRGPSNIGFHKHDLWSVAIISLLAYLMTPYCISLEDQQVVLPYFVEDGWIYLASPRQRLCWIPVECRGELASNGKRVAFGTDDGRVVILDFSDVIV